MNDEANQQIDGLHASIRDVIGTMHKKQPCLSCTINDEANQQTDGLHQSEMLSILRIKNTNLPSMSSPKF